MYIFYSRKHADKRTERNDDNDFATGAVIIGKNAYKAAEQRSQVKNKI